jgi:hypothetical protein
VQSGKRYRQRHITTRKKTSSFSFRSSTPTAFMESSATACTRSIPPTSCAAWLRRNLVKFDGTPLFPEKAARATLRPIPTWSCSPASWRGHQRALRAARHWARSPLSWPPAASPRPEGRVAEPVWPVAGRGQRHRSQQASALLDEADHRSQSRKPQRPCPSIWTWLPTKQCRGEAREGVAGRERLPRAAARSVAGQVSIRAAGSL